MSGKTDGPAFPALPVWWNGQLVPSSAALVSTNSQGWLWGRGLFETIAVRNAIPLALSRHLSRFLTNAPRLGLLPPPEPTLRQSIDQVLQNCPPELHRLRITLTGGNTPGLSLSPDHGHLLIQALPSTPAIRPASLVTVPWRRNEFSALTGIKSTSYAENAIALTWAQERQASEAIFLNSTGDLCEGAVSNLFLVSKGQILTPSLNSGCLPGITRSLVLDLCQQLNLPHLEKALTPAHLATADALFLTNSLNGIIPVQLCDSRKFDALCPLTARLSEALQDLLGRLPDP